MIVFRYLSREVLVTLSAVSAVLLVIIMSGRFIKYLAQAAAGLLDPGSLFLIMGFRLPGFLQLILPLGLFLGILLAYGRLYLESEMTVLSATGMSQQRLLGMTMIPAAGVALIVAWLSLSLAPQGAMQFQLVLNKQDAMTEFDTLEPGRFQALNDGSRVTYTETMTDDRANLGGVFISQKNQGENQKDRGISILVADSGRQEVRPDGPGLAHVAYRDLQGMYRVAAHDRRGAICAAVEHDQHFDRLIAQAFVLSGAQGSAQAIFKQVFFVMRRNQDADHRRPSSAATERGSRLHSSRMKSAS